MNIGIVGFGKMGSEIFDLMHGVSSVDSIVVVSIEDIEQPAEKIVKNLDKSLRRKRITEEEYEKRKNSFRFTHEVSDLKDCDLVIECIFENMDAKKELFAAVSSVVSSSCILATNTSSLSIDGIFENVPERSRCTGMHFFYPVKFSEYVELNVTEQTSDKVTETLISLIREAGKKPVIFRGMYHIYLNQYISYCICAGIQLAEEKNCSILNGKTILSQLFPMHGLFGMADSIGLKLLTTKESNFSNGRIQPLIGYGCDVMTSWMDAGCSGAPGMLFDYLSENQNSDGSADPDEFIADMAAVVLNEAVYAANETEGGRELVAALESAVGLDAPMSDYYKKFGYDAIASRLSAFYKKTGMDGYVPAEKSLYEQFLG